MDLQPSPKVEQLQRELWEFMHERVFPAEPVWAEQVANAPRFAHPPVLEDLKSEARKRGLWNLFLPDPEWGASLTNLEYAPLAEITGWSLPLAPEALNCSAPDTGNMEILAGFATPAVKERWLVPLLKGEIRSVFGMTEPDVASSDATNISTRIERSGDEYVINGRKWWSSGAMRDRCKVTILMGVTNPDADRHRRQSMVVVPLDTPGIQIVRSTSLFGYDDSAHGGHAEIVYDDVRVPVENMLGNEGDGFLIAQARLGPGRIHHCMRALGAAERALQLLCQRVKQRIAFGEPLAEQGVIQEWIADSRIEIEQARLLVLKAARMMDTVGNKEARTEIAAIKVAVPSAALRVVDRAIQAFGGAGVTEDLPLAYAAAALRTLRIADGPDEVHRRSLARWELRRYDRQPNPTSEAGA